MLTFKESADLAQWRGLFGKQSTMPDTEQLRVISWISLFHAISVHYTGQPAVVTSWFRNDDTAHFNGGAVDFRTKHYTDHAREQLEGIAIDAGIPLVRVKIGTPAEHWHCGPLATKVYER